MSLFVAAIDIYFVVVVVHCCLFCCSLLLLMFILLLLFIVVYFVVVSVMSVFLRVLFAFCSYVRVAVVAFRGGWGPRVCMYLHVCRCVYLYFVNLFVN